MTRAALLTPELSAIVETLRSRLNSASLSGGLVAGHGAFAAELAGVCTIAARRVDDRSAYGTSSVLALHAAAELLQRLADDAARLDAGQRPAPKPASAPSLPPQPLPPLRMFCARLPDVEPKR